MSENIRIIEDDYSDSEHVSSEDDYDSEDTFRPWGIRGDQSEDNDVSTHDNESSDDEESENDEESRVDENNTDEDSYKEIEKISKKSKLIA